MARDARRTPPTPIRFRVRHRLPLRLEGLEDRVTPAYTGTPTGTGFLLLGDAAGDNLTITVNGGLLAHNRAGDGGFNSGFDFDSAAAGDQVIPAAGTVTLDIDAGDGNDTIQLGTGVNTLGAVDGGAGTDTLDYSGVNTNAVAVNLGLGVTGLTGALGGDQEVPATTSTATGTATVTNYSVANKTFDITVAVDGVPAADVTGFHIHRAPVGVNGPVIVDLQPLGPLTPTATGFTFTATGVALPALQEAAFLGGITYVNVHTAAFPGGVIRGQLFSQGNVNVATGTATGAVSVTAVENATGAGGNDSLVGNNQANVLIGNGGNDTIVGAPGGDTMDGGVGDDVMVWSNGDGSDTMDGGAGADTVQVNGSLTANDVFDVAAGAGGRIDFDRLSPGPFNLDIGTTETLTVNGVTGNDSFTVNDLSTVTGLTRLNLNGFGGDDTVTFLATAGTTDVFVHGGPGTDTLIGTDTGLTYEVTGANAGTVTNLVDGFTFVENLVGGNGDDTFRIGATGSLGGTIDGGTGTDLLDYDTTTGVSVNLGTNAPGLTATLGGDQEVPAVAVTATGTATVSNYDPVALTFDIAVTVDGIPAADVTGFHIHRAPVGVNGPVIVDLMALGALTPTATGFTFNATGVSLGNSLLGGATNEAAFLGGITYVNVHTAAFPAGAVRGQLFPSGLFVAAPGRATGTAGISNLENVDGGDGNDSLVGSITSNVLRGFGGNDIIVGSRGNDTMNGGADNDILVWSNGDNNDVIDGDAGTDIVQVNGALGGANFDDVFTIVPGAGGRVDFDRTNLVPFSLDIGTTETLTVNGIAGNDKFTVGSLTGVTDLVDLRLNGFDGNDEFTVAPAASTTVTVTGGAPTAAAGDMLTVDLTGATNPALAVTAVAGDGRTGTWTFGNRQPVNFVGVETLAPTADLSVTITDSPDPAQAGGNLTYTITVTNNGTIAATGVQLQDVLPANTTFVSFAAPAGWTTNTPAAGATGTVTATIGTLAAGSGPQTFTLVVRATGTAGGTTVTNTATVSSSADPTPANNTAAAATTVVAAADVAVTVTGAASGVVTAGTQATYTVVVTNNGPSAVTGVNLTTALPAALSGVTFTATGAGGATGFTASGAGSLAETLSLPAGASVTYTIVGTVGAGATGTLNVSATAAVPATITDANPSNNTDTVTESISPPPTGLVGVSNYAAGQDVGGGGVRFFEADGDELFAVTPFAGFTGGVRVAVADVNGDGTPDLIVGTGPGVVTGVRVLDGKTKTEIFSVQPFEAAFTGGVYVAAGDVNGDGKAEVVVTPDQGGGPVVAVYGGAQIAAGKTGEAAQVTRFLGIEDPNFRGGARAALADLDGDGKADLIVAAGFTGGPRVAVFKGASVAAGSLPVKFFGDLFVFEQTLRNGAFVAGGDVSGDGKADLIFGGGPGGGPRVRIVDGRTLLTTPGIDNLDEDVPSTPGLQIGNFFAGDTSNRGGIRVAVKDLDGDSKADVVVGAGTGAGSRVTAYAGKNVPANGTPPELDAFDAFPGFGGGVFVG